VDAIFLAKNRFKRLSYGNKFGLFRLNLARKKLAKALWVAKKARDKEPVLDSKLLLYNLIDPKSVQ